MVNTLAGLTLNGGTLSSTASPSSIWGSWVLTQNVTAGFRHFHH